MKGTVLVTGGCGYIGSHTSIELINAGYDVVIYDNLSNSNADTINRIYDITGKRPIFVQADCRSADIMGNMIIRFKPDAIIHFAAYKAVGESVNKPLAYYDNNINSLLNILDTIKHTDKANIVFSSSCTVYGQPDHSPVTEDTPRKDALSPYGNTKRLCEDIINDAAHAYDNIHSIILRYFNPIGAHPSGLIGELPNGVPNNLLPYVTQTAAGIRECLSVFGDDYDTLDGSCIRDYINIVDLAKAHVCAVDRLLGHDMGSNVEVFNIGTGKGVSTLEIVRTFEKVNDLKLNYKIVGRREGDIEAIWADPTRANEVLGWKAEVGLEDTLRSAWKWQKHSLKF